MSNYNNLSAEELKSLKAELEAEYNKVKAKGLSLNMARGKPSGAQVALSMKMLDTIKSDTEVPADYLNYGLLDGTPEAKKLIGDMLEVDPTLVFVGGTSSLNLMHDLFGMMYSFGGSEQQAWCKQDSYKFLCPSPGYDRHFAVSEHYGAELVQVDMTDNGPNMDQVEELVKDPNVKGIWCVPKYSNPTGITYSDETVKRLANLSPAAPDFRIFWDNAYTVHHLDVDNPDQLLDIMSELEKTGKANMIFMFSSTAKVTFAGAGVSGVASGKENIAWLNKHMSFQTISYDKINQVRHARFLPNIEAVNDHMRGHAAILAPKFDVVCDSLAALDGLGIASWVRPKGGYFVSLDVLSGCAKRVVELCKEAGLIVTPAGATHPYGKDPKDTTIRIAPSFPPVNELEQAMELICLCTKLAAAEKLLSN